MAGIDSSIYLQQQTPDFIGSIQKGLSMRDMLDQRSLRQKQVAENDAIKAAYKKGVVQNPDGTTSFNGELTASELMGVNPEKGLEFKAQQRAQEAEAQKAQRETMKQNAESVARYGMTAMQNPSMWPQIRAEIIQKGLAKENEIPMGYDPNFVKMQVGRAMSVTEQYGRVDKERDQTRLDNAAKLDREKFELEKKKTQASLSPGSMKLTDGQKTVDKEFGKDYNEWTSGGSKLARSEILKIQNVANKLKNKSVTTGGLTGFFPDRMTSNDVLSARADIQSTIMSSLRAILGPAFTEKEGERVIKNTWNEADSTENNLARIEKLVENLENQAADKDKKAEYYEKNKGSLAGFKAGPQQEPDVAQYAQNHGITYEAAKAVKAQRTSKQAGL